jgi:SAM-dependent methyltransferase
MSEVIWHDVECGGYRADLPLWEELADSLGEEDPVMELGCGTGRVTLHLAERGAYLVIGLDRNKELVEAVWERGQGTTGDAEYVDVRDFSFPSTPFSLILAPMQLIQLLAGRADRIRCLTCVAEALAPDGRAAFAIVEEPPAAAPQGSTPPLPDVRQIEGWVYSSLPLEPVVDSESMVLRRLRQIVTPDGDLSEEPDEVKLQLLTAKELEMEALEVGLSSIGRRQIPATESHVGATVVLLKKEP